MKPRLHRSRFHLGSRVGRHIFVLFVVCAVVPLVISMWLAAGVVERHLAQREEERLHLLVKDLAMNVYERVTILADQLAVAGERGSGAVPPVFRVAPLAAPESEVHWASSGFRSIVRTTGDAGAERILGDPPPVLSSLAGRETGIDVARPFVLETVPDPAGGTRLFLGHVPRRRPAAPGERPEVLWGEIDASWLWWGAVGDRTLPEPLELVVLDGRGQVLETTWSSGAERSTATWSEGQPFRSGRFVLDGEEYLGKAWRLSLHALSGSPRLQFVLLEPATSVAAPFSAFVRTTALSGSLALLLIVLLSLVQIRRTLVPLQQLGHAAQTLASGHASASVVVESDDEFRDVAHAFNTMAERLQRQFGILSTGGEIDRAILSSLEPNRILEIAVNGVAALVGAPAAAIALVKGAQDRATVYVHRSDRGDVQREEVAASSLREVSRAGFLRVDGELPEWASPLRDVAPRSLLVAPVSGERTGLLMAGSPHSDAYSDESVAALEGLAEQVSVALANAALVEQLETLQSSTLLVFARAVDLKSTWTSGHSERVAALARELALQLGLDEGGIDLLYRAALVHDIGKIGVPDAVLDKPGPLTPQETEIIRSHVRLGAELLSAVPGYQEVVVIVAQHHEWWNGGGYPAGAAGEDLHPLVRLLSVADVFDALISPRPYRREIAVDIALRMIRELSGHQFAPEVVEPFISMVSRIEWPTNQHAEAPPDALSVRIV